MTTRTITTVLAIRHAESVANKAQYFASQSDAGLSELGEQQVRTLTEALRETPIDVVYSSDLTRAVRTVQPLADQRNLPVLLDPRLREREMGAFTGRTFTDAQEHYPEVWAKMLARDPHVAPPGGESHAQLGQRVAGVVRELCEKHQGKVLVLGAHGGTIMHVLRYLMGVHTDESPLWFTVGNASVSRVDLVEVSPGVIAPRVPYIARVAPSASDPLQF